MDLTNPKLIYLKGLLFLLTGLIACAVILLEHPSLKLAALLGLAIWCFARPYYFAFYVIQHYVDPGYRFAGLFAFARYLVRRRRAS
jgi:type IV secretory pathway TrbD component